MSSRRRGRRPGRRRDRPRDDRDGGSALALDTIYGPLTGAGAARRGAGFLGALTCVAVVAACQAATGPGTGLAAFVFVFVGNALSGGTVAFAFLPDGFRQVAPWLPNGVIVSAVRDVVCLPNSDPGHPLLVLGIWLAGWPCRWPWWPAWTGCTGPHAAAHRNGRPRSTRRRARSTCGSSSPAG